MKTHRDEPRALYSGSAVAELCEVDLKTIHNWANNDEIRHFRTPGRHLRFRGADIVEFLRKYDYPVPDALLAGRPHLYLVDADGSKVPNLKRSLSAAFEVTSFEDPIDAVVSIGVRSPAAIVLDVKLPNVDGLHLLARFRQHRITRESCIVVFSSESVRRKALEAGASAFVVKPDVQMLRESLERLVGLDGAG